jgi:hypothetical protein
MCREICSSQQLRLCAAERGNDVQRSVVAVSRTFETRCLGSSSGFRRLPGVAAGLAARIARIGNRHVLLDACGLSR